MIAWWEGLLTLQQIFVVVALPATLLLFIQTILLFMGIGDGDGGEIDITGDGEADVDAPDSGDGLSVFTLRGIVAMCCVTGWSGVVLLDTALPVWASVSVAILLGVATLVGMAFLMKGISKLQSSGNIDYGNAVGKIAQVYIPIPAFGESAGKVNITVQEKYCEVSAITAGDEPLRTGEYVRVVAVDESGVLLVEKLRGNNNTQKGTKQ